MVLGTKCNQNRARSIENLLQIHSETHPKSLESAVRQFNAQHPDDPYAIDEPDCLLTDLLADLRHFARHRHQTKHALVWSLPHADVVSSPELKGLIDDLREFAEEHDLSWEASLDYSLTHFETEVGDELRVS